MKYLKRFLMICMVCVITMSLVIPTSADMGDFLDRTMDQLKGINLKSYEGQERGYLMGGSASIRFDSYEQPLVSLTAPKLKVGCGGIDLVMGGFSYLNFEYLVQKFQQILAAAPAFAFQIALKTLCESCADTLNSLESIVNQLNNLNVGSCQASKALASFGGEKLGLSVGNSQSSGATTAWFAGLQNTINDFSNSYKSFITDYAGAYDCYTLGTSAAINACLGKTGKVSFKTPLMRQAFLGMSTDIRFEEIFRAYFGDVYETDPGTETPPTVMGDPGCFPEGEYHNVLKALIDGTYQMKMYNTSEYVSAACTKIDLTSLRKGLRHQVEDALTAILGSIRANTPLTAEQINLINSSRIPIYRLLSLAILVEKLGGDTGNILTKDMIQAASVPISYDIGHQALQRLYNIASAKMRAAGSTKETELAAEKVKPILDNINSDLSYAAEQSNKEWRLFADTAFGKSFEQEARFQAFIYQQLARNKLLDSYLFAKGIR